jgi:hypothetical protein
MEEENLYDTFVNSDIGQKIWNEARELYPEYNFSSNDTIEATEFILNYMNVPSTCNEELIIEMIWEGLT